MSNSAITICGNHITVLVVGEDGAMPISTIKNQRLPLWSLAFKTADNAPYNLTGVTYTSATLFDVITNGDYGLLTGVFATVSAALGTATFAPSASDVSYPGSFLVEAVLTTGGLPAYFRFPITVLQSFT